MKAILYTKYGPPDVLQLKGVERPTPKDDGVLVKVLAASANPLDWHRMRGAPFLARLDGGLRKPKDPRLGVDIAGRLEAVSNKATRIKPGDEIANSFKDFQIDSITVSLSGAGDQRHPQIDGQRERPRRSLDRPKTKTRRLER